MILDIIILEDGMSETINGKESMSLENINGPKNYNITVTSDVSFVNCDEEFNIYTFKAIIREKGKEEKNIFLPESLSVEDMEKIKKNKEMFVSLSIIDGEYYIHEILNSSSEK